MTLTAIIVAGMLLVVLLLWNRVRRLEDDMIEMLGSVGKEVSEMQKTQTKINEDLAEAVDDLQEKFEKLPKEDLQARYDAEKAWNEGVQNILNYGLDTMNKGEQG